MNDPVSRPDTAASAVDNSREHRPCSCGDRTRPNINHRVRIPCWTYVGSKRIDVGPKESFVDIARYDWVTISADDGDLLHALDAADDPAEIENQWGGAGTTACGTHDDWVVLPGVFSRMDADRCGACCFQTGIPTGKGSPKNDTALRPLVGLS